MKPAAPKASARRTVPRIFAGRDHDHRHRRDARRARATRPAKSVAVRHLQVQQQQVDRSAPPGPSAHRPGWNIPRSGPSGARARQGRAQGRAEQRMVVGDDDSVGPWRLSPVGRVSRDAVIARHCDTPRPWSKLDQSLMAPKRPRAESRSREVRIRRTREDTMTRTHLLGRHRRHRPAGRARPYRRPVAGSGGAGSPDRPARSRR